METIATEASVVTGPGPEAVPAPEWVDRCPLCGSGDLRVWRRRCKDRLHHRVAGPFAYERCRGCGLAFLSPRLPEADAHRLYPEDYAPYASAPAGPASPPRPSPATRLLGRGPVQRSASWLSGALDRRYPDRLEQELQGVYTPERPGLALLDFGCGSAEFLDGMRARGWRTVGADFMPEVVDGVRRRGHQGELVDDGFWNRVDDASLAVVRMNHVLEHLYRPRHVLSEVRRVLAPGGVAHIAMPNPDSVWSGLFRSRWFDLDCPRHVMLYPPRVLCSLLVELGFREARIVHQVLTTVMVRSWGYVLHDLRRIEHSQITALVDDEVRARVLHLPARVAAVLGRADRYHAFAYV